MKLHVTPDTGISGLSTYRFSRQTMLWLVRKRQV
jgi:hypothetical protein